MAKLNLNLTGHQITDEVLTRTSAAAAGLEHDTILDVAGLTIRTAASGGGTLLTETTDFVLGSKDTALTTAAGADVWTTLAIVNGTYQNIPLYVTYKTVGDYAEAADVGILFVPFVISAANQAYTLPDAKLAGAQGIRISWSGGNGTYKLTITGSINGVTGWLGHGTGSLTIYSDGAAWYAEGEGEYDVCVTTTGTFVKHINGRMYASDAGSVTDWPIATAYASLYQGSRSFTFPLAFYAAPVGIAGRAKYGTSASWVGEAAASTTEISIRAFDAVSRPTGTAVVYSWQATGRWRA